MPPAVRSQRVDADLCRCSFLTTYCTQRWSFLTLTQLTYPHLIRFVKYTPTYSFCLLSLPGLWPYFATKLTLFIGNSAVDQSFTVPPRSPPAESTTDRQSDVYDILPPTWPRTVENNCNSSQVGAAFAPAASSDPDEIYDTLPPTTRPKQLIPANQSATPNATQSRDSSNSIENDTMNENMTQLHAASGAGDSTSSSVRSSDQNPEQIYDVLPPTKHIATHRPVSSPHKQANNHTTSNQQRLENGFNHHTTGGATDGYPLYDRPKPRPAARRKIPNPNSVSLYNSCLWFANWVVSKVICCSSLSSCSVKQRADYSVLPLHCFVSSLTDAFWKWKQWRNVYFNRVR